MSGNGRAPIAFPPAAIPIVGQPFTLKGWFPTVVIVCNCGEAHEPILLVGEGPQACPACKRTFVIAHVTHQHGQPPQIGIGIVQQNRPEVSA